MTSTVVAIITCERCGQAGQTTATWSIDDYGQPEPEGYFRTELPDTWRGPITYHKRMFNVAVEEIVPDTVGYTDEPWISKRVDLCPTCRMAFLTWWLEGRP
jgi:hypothetical protein